MTNLQFTNMAGKKEKFILFKSLHTKLILGASATKHPKGHFCNDNLCHPDWHSDVSNSP